MISQYIREYFHKFVNSNLKRFFIYLSKFNLGVIFLHPVYLIISLIVTSLAFLLNLFAFMNIFPLWLSLPFLFISIYFSLYFFMRFITFMSRSKLRQNKSHLSQLLESFLIYYSSNNLSNSVNFSSNTLSASKIGCFEVISTPALLNTSIG